MHCLDAQKIYVEIPFLFNIYSSAGGASEMQKVEYP